MTVEMQKAASLSDTRKLNQLLKESTGKTSKDMASVRDKHGNILTTPDKAVETLEASFPETPKSPSGPFITCS
ncbi:hypothetical protein QYM36_000778 [Artemia franciscana]|uniref:Uncharacterized protein n=1 Tax=Artemia franciscana TaxID=6661 RepID=A0AA88LDI5_ARTSF|nr:hypothetical protein QYM36_000778 [Artemia franciscana]